MSWQVLSMFASTVSSFFLVYNIVPGEEFIVMTEFMLEVLARDCHRSILELLSLFLGFGIPKLLCWCNITYS